MNTQEREKPKILYVDDEMASLTGFKSVFRDHYEIFTAPSANEGYKIMKERDIDLVISDQRMPEMTGVDFLQKIRLEFPDTVRMIITGYSDIDAVIRAINKSMVYYYFSKPYDTSDMKYIIDNAIERQMLKKQSQELLDKLAQMVSELKLKRDELEKEVKQRMTAEEEVRKLNRELLSLDKAKADFLKIISHEIRTPLNGIIGPIELLKDEIITADLMDIFTILDNSVKRLEKFASTALRITDLQTRACKLKPQLIDIVTMVEEIVGMSNSRIKKRALKIKKAFSPENLTFNADRELIELCLNNIIDNAFKHTGHNTTVSITALKHGEEFIFQVADEGPGFHENILKHYHKLFNIGEYHVDSNTGLDLALTRMIVDAHGGTMALSNRSGGGAVVKIMFRI